MRFRSPYTLSTRPVIVNPTVITLQTDQKIVPFHEKRKKNTNRWLARTLQSWAKLQGRLHIPSNMVLSIHLPWALTADEEPPEKITLSWLNSLDLLKKWKEINITNRETIEKLKQVFVKDSAKLWWYLENIVVNVGFSFLD